MTYEPKQINIELTEDQLSKLAPMIDVAESLDCNWAIAAQIFIHDEETVTARCRLVAGMHANSLRKAFQEVKDHALTVQ